MYCCLVLLAKESTALTSVAVIFASDTSVILANVNEPSHISLDDAFREFASLKRNQNLPNFVIVVTCHFVYSHFACSHFVNDGLVMIMHWLVNFQL